MPLSILSVVKKRLNLIVLLISVILTIFFTIL